MAWRKDPGSFRDPRGFVFRSDGVLFRQVNEAFGDEYRRFVDSGLYDDLQRDGLIVSHREVDVRVPGGPPAAAVLQPEELPFISYPYEWCFSQLKAAAELTLELQRRAIAHGMVLRDASAYNVQFLGPRPIFIDTLSFGTYVEGKPWAAYRQFCAHFRAPLALVALSDESLNQLLRVHIDGIPLKLAAKLLPVSSRMRPGLLTHLHLHARAGARDDGQGAGGSASPAIGVSKTALLGLVDSLLRTVKGLCWSPSDTMWSTYTETSNYSAAAQEHKKRLIAEWVERLEATAPPASIWDLGANTGDYSQLVAGDRRTVVSFDLDHAAVEQHYRRCRTQPDRNVLPLLQDLTNPSGGIGWRNAERRTLEERGPADLVLALALVHHLVITGNVPLPDVAAFFASASKHLIVEFVPPNDSQVQRMLQFRDEGIHDYSQQAFENAFTSQFDIADRASVDGTVRTLYFMTRRESAA
jgi:hypothetical protein